ESAAVWSAIADDGRVHGGTTDCVLPAVPRFRTEPQLGILRPRRISLEDAQRAKVDAVLARCQLQPSMRLLDVGCGWGAAVRRAAELYGVCPIGITMSPEQCRYARQKLTTELMGSTVEIRVQSWEEFNEPVDRIICVNAFETSTTSAAS